MAEDRPKGGWRWIPKSDCAHLESLGEGISSERAACQACGHAEDLRICLTCGYVGCCESHAAHNTAHFRETGHPFIRPHGSAYDWLWCYRCNAFLQ